MRVNKVVRADPQQLVAASIIDERGGRPYGEGRIDGRSALGPIRGEAAAAPAVQCTRGRKSTGEVAADADL